eukprot:PhF_6_TR14930/c0_g1_i3/m.23351
MGCGSSKQKHPPAFLTLSAIVPPSGILTASRTLESPGVIVTHEVQIPPSNPNPTLESIVTHEVQIPQNINVPQDPTTEPKDSLSLAPSSDNKESDPEPTPEPIIEKFVETKAAIVTVVHYNLQELSQVLYQCCAQQSIEASVGIEKQIDEEGTSYFVILSYNQPKQRRSTFIIEMQNIISDDEFQHIATPFRWSARSHEIRFFFDISQEGCPSVIHNDEVFVPLQVAS